MKGKKLLSLGLVVIMALTLLAGCGKKDEGTVTPPAEGENQTDGGEGTENTSNEGGTSAESVYFLNFKPEIAAEYDKIASDYEAETGVKLKVQTAASGTYEQTLKSEIAKKDAPTIFQINGPVGFQSWKDYCLDLKDTELYSHLTDKSLAVTEGEGVYGIPYAVEGYGIIYNNAIMDKYFALSGRASSVTSMEEINSFAKLKEVAEDMQAHKDELGIKGVFASTSLGSGEQWRWQTHLANIPLYYEFKEYPEYDNTILAGLNSDTIEFKYSNEFKNIFDLYINNSCSDKGLLGSKSVADAMADFALGNAAMVQNGNWAWSQIKDVEGNTVNEADIKFLPIYTGIQGEQNQGLCIGTENYFAVNSQVSEAQQNAAIDFINWLFTSDTGKNYVTGELGFIAPFDTFTDDQKPNDPLSKEVMNWMEKDVESVTWTFAAFPSENFKNAFGDALLEYVQGSMDFDGVVAVVKENWEIEKANLAE